MLLKSWKIIVTVIIIVAFGGLSAQNDGGNAGENAGDTSAADKSKPNMVTLSIIEDMENCETWRVKTTGLSGETRLQKTAGFPVKLASNKEELQQRPTKYTLGVRTFFKPRESAAVSIIPPQPLRIDGRCENIHVWVLGRNFTHKLFIVIQDYRGHHYRLKLEEDPSRKTTDNEGNEITVAKLREKEGSVPAKNLGYLGWRKLSVKIPGYVPQTTKYGGQGKIIRIVKFELQQNPFEQEGLFYVYLDHITAESRLYQKPYDGDSIKDNW